VKPDSRHPKNIKINSEEFTLYKAGCFSGGLNALSVAWKSFTMQ
jgi:hypothetical protein